MVQEADVMKKRRPVEIQTTGGVFFDLFERGKAERLSIQSGLALAPDLANHLAGPIRRGIPRGSRPLRDGNPRNCISSGIRVAAFSQSRA